MRSLETTSLLSVALPHLIEAVIIAPRNSFVPMRRDFVSLGRRHVRPRRLHVAPRWLIDRARRSPVLLRRSYFLAKAATSESSNAKIRPQQITNVSGV